MSLELFSELLLLHSREIPNLPVMQQQQFGMLELMLV
jgi:hypothetical protein